MPADYIQLPPKVTRDGGGLKADFRGSQLRSKHPKSLDCDCCCAASVHLVCHQIRPVCFAPFNNPVLRAEFPDLQYWCACELCEPIFNDVSVMSERLTFALGAQMLNARAYFSWLHGVIVSAQTGVTRVWVSGDEWPLCPPKGY